MQIPIYHRIHNYDQKIHHTWLIKEYWENGKYLNPPVWAFKESDFLFSLNCEVGDIIKSGVSNFVNNKLSVRGHFEIVGIRDNNTAILRPIQEPFVGPLLKTARRCSYLLNRKISLTRKLLTANHFITAYISGQPLTFFIGSNENISWLSESAIKRLGLRTKTNKRIVDIDIIIRRHNYNVVIKKVRLYETQNSFMPCDGILGSRITFKPIEFHR